MNIFIILFQDNFGEVTLNWINKLGFIKIERKNNKAEKSHQQKFKKMLENNAIL